MATPAPYCGFQGPSESSGELNFEFTCGKILLLQSPLRHEEIQRASRTPVLGVFAIAIIVDLQKQQRIVVAVFKTKEIFPLHQSRPAEQFAEAGMVVGTVRKAETADRLPEARLVLYSASSAVSRGCGGARLSSLHGDI
jgi:hypothetical protein